MPQLQEFQNTSDNQDGGGNYPGLDVIRDEEYKKAPEYLIKNTA